MTLEMLAFDFVMAVGMSVLAVPFLFASVLCVW